MGLAVGAESAGCWRGGGRATMACGCGVTGALSEGSVSHSSCAALRLGAEGPGARQRVGRSGVSCTTSSSPPCQVNRERWPKVPIISTREARVKDRFASRGGGRLGAVTPYVTAGAGFLLAVLWFDLMHDVQVLTGPSGRGAPEEDPVRSIASYYRRVTTDARPMNRLIAVVMAATLVAIVIQIANGDAPRWVGWASLVFAGMPITWAARRTVPNAVRLGSRSDTEAEQSRLARAICFDHLACFGSVSLLLAIQLAFRPA
jgi:hypothetical protein